MQLLFDIGGTKSRIGISKNNNTISRYEIVATPKDFISAMDVLCQRAFVLTAGKKADLAVMGVAAPLNKEKTALASTGVLPSWLNRPLKKILEERLGTPTYLENDAITAALGEGELGAGRGYDIVGYLTFSTGIGGAKVIKGKSEASRFGFEPGHMITHAHQGTKEKGTDEKIWSRLSGLAIKKTFGQSPEDITDPQFWEDITRLMAITINNAMVMWSPDVLIIGGGLTKGIKLKKVIQATKKICRAFPELPAIKLAALGDIGGLYGALQIAKTIRSQQKKKSPLF